MRALLLGLFVALSATAADAQQLASVRVEARVRIPDFLSLTTGQTQDFTRSDGVRVRRVTLYVKANRSWNLQIMRMGGIVDVATGASGNAVPVTVEIPWSSTTPPNTNELRYYLTAG